MNKPLATLLACCALAPSVASASGSSSSPRDQMVDNVYTIYDALDNQYQLTGVCPKYTGWFPSGMADTPRSWNRAPPSVWGWLPSLGDVVGIYSAGLFGLNLDCGVSGSIPVGDNLWETFTLVKDRNGDLHATSTCRNYADDIDIDGACDPADTTSARSETSSKESEASAK